MSIDRSTGLIQWDVPQGAAGEYKIGVRVSDRSSSDTQSYTLTITPELPACGASVGQFCVRFYNNKDLEGIPVVSQVEDLQKRPAGHGIHHLWTGSPADGVDANRFSVVWEGDFQFEESIYTFSTTPDDGMRLYVDGDLLIDHWSDGATTLTVEKAMTASVHRVRVEFYDGSGDALAEFFWNTAPTITNLDDASRYTVTG